MTFLTLSSLFSLPLGALDFSLPRNNYSPHESIFLASYGPDLQKVIYQFTNYYHDFDLIYRSNGGDSCNMKKAREILSKYHGKRKAFTFRKKGGSELFGFTLDTNIDFFDLETMKSGPIRDQKYLNPNMNILRDSKSSYFRIIGPGNF
jgi:hypothetical protein